MAKKKAEGRITKKSTSKSKLAPPPFPLAMVVCDGIHRDPGTGKLTLLGCFSVIGVAELPAVHESMGLYIELTNGRGKVPFLCRLVDANEDLEPLWEHKDEIEIEDPRVVLQIALPIQNVLFSQAGEYRIQLYACNEFLMERRVLVHSLSSESTKKNKP
jgi:hypothetical protein